MVACHYIFCPSEGCRVTNCSRVTDALLLPYARLDGCIAERCSVLSSAADRTVIEGGAVVRDALLQWGAHVDTMACVDAAVICEHGHVDRHGKLLGSLLGPMSGIGCFTGCQAGYALMLFDSFGVTFKTLAA
jgi:hypothetical protein